MELKFDKCKYNIDSEGFWLSLKVINKEQAMLFIENMKDKLHIADLKVFRKKRGLDANAYFWVLCQKIAEVINSTKDEVYLKLLGDAGVFTHVIVKPEAVERVKEEWRVVKNLGEVTVNGKTGVQLQLYYGSSTYDTKEMSVLIDETVRQAKELKIETLPPEELASMKEAWGNETQANKSNRNNNGN